MADSIDFGGASIVLALEPTAIVDTNLLFIGAVEVFSNSQLLTNNTIELDYTAIYVPEPLSLENRYARPTMDMVNTGWQASSGTALYSMIDEETPSDIDYIFATTKGASYQAKLQPVEDPSTTTDQIVKYRVRSYYNNNIIVTLKQGSTVIATRTHTNVPNEWTTYSMILSEYEINAITDYTDLRVIIEVA